jgi:Ca2+-binding EF-hand superfamily protein
VALGVEGETMFRNPLSCRGPLALGLVALLAASAPGAEKPDPPGTGALMGQLRVLFRTWDLNKDGQLDKDELARAFRGADARASDYLLDLKALKEKKNSKRARQTFFTNYPDYHFLLEVDQDGDDKISRGEFMIWARDYVVDLKKQLETEQRVLQAEAKMEQGLADKELKLLQEELKLDKEALKTWEKEMKAYEQLMKQLLAPHHMKGGKH